MRTESTRRMKMDIEIKVNPQILPQLIVISVVTESPGGGGPFITNHCCMVRDVDELREEVDRLKEAIEEDEYKILNAVATHVSSSIYAKSGTKTRGIKAKHAIVSPICRTNKTVEGAGREAAETDWLQLGKDIIQGIANGIDLAAGKIGDIVKTAVQNAIDAAKAFLGISSPSKVTMEQIGLPMGEGVALGVEHSIPDTEAAMANLTGSMLGVPAVAGSGGSGAGSADNIFNFDFTNALITNKNELERWIDQALAKRGIQADQRRRI